MWNNSLMSDKPELSVVKARHFKEPIDTDTVKATVSTFSIKMRRGLFSVHSFVQSFNLNHKIDLICAHPVPHQSHTVFLDTFRKLALIN